MRLNIFKIIVLVIVLQSCSHSNKAWIKNYGYANWDKAYDVVQTNDDGFLISGYSLHEEGHFNGGKDYWLVKLNPSGNMIWEKKFQGITGGGYEFPCKSILGVSNDRYLLTGEDSNNTEAIWAKLIDNNGEEIWNKTYEGEHQKSAISITETSDNNFIILGTERLNNSHDINLYFIKIDIEGNLLWEKRWGKEDQIEKATDIISSSNGSYYILGNTSNGGVKTINTDILLLNIDDTGKIIWEKSYEDEFSKSEAFSICESEEGDLMTVGHIDDKIMISKFNNSGNLLWQKRFVDSLSGMGFSVLPKDDNSFIACGFERPMSGPPPTEIYSDGSDKIVILDSEKIADPADAIVIEFDANGKILSKEVFGGTDSDYLYNLKQTNDNGYILVGTTHSQDHDISKSYGFWDYFVVKLK